MTLSEIPNDPVLRDQWDDLVLQMDHPEVFYTYEWAIAVQRAYSNSLKPLLFLGYEDDALVAVAALAIFQDGKVGFLASSTADYCDFLTRPELGGQWCDAVLVELRKLGFPSLELANLPADSVTACVISKTAGKCGYRAFTRPAYRCAHISLGNSQRRQSLREHVTGKKLVRRSLKSMSRDGEVTFVNSVATEDLEPVLSEFYRAHVARFLSTGRISNLTHPERRRFLSQLAVELSRSGWLALSQLRVGNGTLAWNYGFQFAGSWFWYQPTFALEHEHLSPGLCLLSKVIENACESAAIHTVDLGLGSEEYKDRFATETRQTVHVTLSSSPATYCKAVLRYRLSEFAKRKRSRERVLRQLVYRVTSLRSKMRQTGVAHFSYAQMKRCWRALFGCEEVCFFQWPDYGGANGAPDSPAVKTVDFDLLALAATQYFDDDQTLAYLVRAGQRLRDSNYQAYALMTPDGIPVHFCWTAKFQGFPMAELRRKLEAAHPDAVLIFDCWTPPSLRGRGHFAAAIREVAGRLLASGKSPWIFGAATNRASLRGVEKAGFVYRFSLGRRRIFGVARDETSTVSAAYSFSADPLLP